MNARELHLWWGWVMIVTNGLAGLWALAAHRWAAARHRSLWWFTVLAQLAVFVQATVGVLILQEEPDLEPPSFHLFYGFSGIIAIAVLYGYRDQLRHRLYLLYGGGGLFLMGLGIRAIIVGPS